jgi:hypothetical protein
MKMSPAYADHRGRTSTGFPRDILIVIVAIPDIARYWI